jgi:hypothetical protein
MLHLHHAMTCVISAAMSVSVPHSLQPVEEPPSINVQPLLAVGVMTTPKAFNARGWLRQHMQQWMQHQKIFFVLGDYQRCPPSYWRGEAYPDDVSEERRIHEDIVIVDSPDCAKMHLIWKVARWWQYAASLDGYRWVAKTDDDSLWNMPALLSDLAVLESALSSDAARQNVYYGAMNYRSFSLRHSVACGDHAFNAPPMKALAPPKNCAGEVVGPYPYADGSFVLLSAALNRATLATAHGQAVLNATYDQACRRGKDVGEDTAVGAVVFSEGARLQLPTTFAALQGWRDNRPWMDLRHNATQGKWHNNTLPDEHTLWVHRVFTALTAELAARSFGRHPRSSGLWSCGGCDAWAIHRRQSTDSRPQTNGAPAPEEHTIAASGPAVTTCCARRVVRTHVSSDPVREEFE